MKVRTPKRASPVGGACRGGLRGAWRLDGRWWLVAASIIAAGTPGRTQEPRRPDATFRTAVEAVEIDVYVTDETGRPVAGLTADDFELFENGARQPITTFSAVDIPIETRERGELEMAEPDVQANSGPEGRLYVFALDEVYGANILRTRRLVRDFLENHFGPHDVGAVVLLGRGLATDGQAFTSNRRLLIEAVDKFSGGGNPPGVDPGLTPLQQQTYVTLPGGSCEEAQPGDAGTGATLIPLPNRYAARNMQFESLRSLAELLGRMPGRHKAMLVFTECLMSDVLDVVDYRGGVLGLAWEDAHAMMTAATRSNVAIYPIDPRGLTPEGTPLDNIGRFRALAETTGGVALINSNRYTETFEQIVRDNSTYYMLGFNAAYANDDGTYVQLDVRVTRPGLTVRTRGGYVAPTRDERRARDRAREDGMRAVSTATAALASPLTTDGVPIRVFAAPFRRDGNRARVGLAVELDAAALDLTFAGGAYTGEVDVSYLITDAKRRIFPERRHTATVRLEPNTGFPASLDGVRIRVLTELELEKGRYQLRVAAGTPAHAGSVVYDLDVPDFSAGDLTLSGLSLLVPSERRVLTLRAEDSNGSVAPVTCDSERCAPPREDARLPRPRTAAAAEPYPDGRFPGPPTAVREFGPGDEIVVAVEVYDNQRTRGNRSPYLMTLAASLRGQDGQVVPLGSSTRSAAAAGSRPGDRAFALPVRVPEVAPGTYALQVEASSGGGEGRTASRTIPIRVR